MSKPPRLNLASIVAAAVPQAKAAGQGRSAAQGKSTAQGTGAVPAQTAEIVQLDTGHAPARTPSAGQKASTLKARARQMSVYLEPPVYDQLRELAHAERTKMHALMIEALDLLFKQRGSISIDQLNEPGQR